MKLKDSESVVTVGGGWGCSHWWLMVYKYSNEATLNPQGSYYLLQNAQLQLWPQLYYHNGQHNGVLRLT